MPANKKAITRIQILDELLSNRYQQNTIEKLTEKVNDKLNEMGFDSVGQRTIEKDIYYLECEGPFDVEIERYSAGLLNKSENQRGRMPQCLRYKESSFSIFKKQMSDEEKQILSEALSLLGQFDGLPDLGSLENLRANLKATNCERKAISFTKNPLQNSNLLGKLFLSITNKQVVEIDYKPFASDTNKTIILHPHLLKEYNRRWYIFGTADSDQKLLHFNLDCINSVEMLPSYEYIDFEEDINEFFEDIIGVTLHEENPVEEILFWVSDKSKHYVANKPIHESQILYETIKEQQLRVQYPMLENGFFFKIECRENYELIRELSSFGKELLVLSPKSIQDKIYERLNEIIADYDILRTKTS